MIRFFPMSMNYKIVGWSTGKQYCQYTVCQYTVLAGPSQYQYTEEKKSRFSCVFLRVMALCSL